MPSDPDSDRTSPLSRPERARLAAFRAAESLADLVALTGAADADEAYLAAKEEWTSLRERELGPASTDADFPGRTVTIDGRPFVVHGVTHANTPEERAYLRERVGRLREAGAAVYCEQGIRSMYFADFPDVCEMDDYRWAMTELSGREEGAPGDGLAPAAFGEFFDDVESAAETGRRLAYSLIDSGREIYGEAIATALGDVATSFLTGPTDLSTADDFASFVLSTRAARDPSRLAALQRYYETRFLPQPIERTWLRRHDPDLEVATHARNERMADYLRYHATEAPAVHAIVGAAHQPGVAYYLERHSTGERTIEGFEPMG
ncbi:hypothetical protein [Halovivax sp.]|uniref:hypothetical protein n=1 Tax=Halovivax sp. TaxID=1935978 RepID=UPI0025BE24B8|nr:hypothetical protein [Halovivax sp.]